MVGFIVHNKKINAEQPFIKSKKKNCIKKNSTHLYYTWNTTVNKTKE